MPVLPLIDLLILLGWTSVMLAMALKAIWMTTVYRPTILTLDPLDLLVGGAVLLLFALTLAARTWVKLNEPKLLVARRGRSTEEDADARWGSGELRPSLAAVEAEAARAKAAAREDAEAEAEPQRRRGKRRRAETASSR